MKLTLPVFIRTAVFVENFVSRAIACAQGHASFGQSQLLNFRSLATAKCAGFEERISLESFAFAQFQEKLTSKERKFHREKGKLRNESTNPQEKIWKVRFISKKVKNEILAPGASGEMKYWHQVRRRNGRIVISGESNSGTSASRNAICTQT